MRIAEEHVVFFQELGMAIDQWAQLEMSLFHSLSICFPLAQRRLIYNGYIAMDGFRTKLNFVSNVMSEKFSNTNHIDDLKTLVKRLAALSKSRNKLAHWRQHIYPSSPPGRRHALVPWSLEPVSVAEKLSMLPPRGALCLRDINAARNAFFAANMSLVNLRCRILSVTEAVSKSAEIPRKPLTLSELRRGIRMLVVGGEQ